MRDLLLAGVDIGSNAVRLLVSRVTRNGSDPRLKEVSFIRVPLRLGSDAFTGGRISRTMARRLVDAMGAFRTLMTVYGVERYMACATAAMREAENGPEIIREIRRRAGVRVEIVSGRREAEIIYHNHVAEGLQRKGASLYIEVGGGSTELTLFAKGRLRKSEAFNLGTIRILYGKDQAQEWERMRRWIKEHAKDWDPLVGIGTGGNINRIFRISGLPLGRPITRSVLRDLYEELAECPVEKRIRKYDLNPDRADVIVPAARIFLTVMERSDIRELFVPNLQLVDGIVHVLSEAPRYGHRP